MTLKLAILLHAVCLAAVGVVTNWEFELGSPNTLMRYGWKRESLSVGNEVTVDGFLATDGSKLANAKAVRFADGRIVNADSSVDTGYTTDKQ